MRCGSVEDIRKGLRETKCTLYKKEEGTQADICECKEADERIERKLTDELKQWKKGSELERKVNIKLTGKPVRDLCEYVAEFEKSAKKEKLRN